jgi:hypothetical protein
MRLFFELQVVYKIKTIKRLGRGGATFLRELRNTENPETDQHAGYRVNSVYG